MERVAVENRLHHLPDCSGTDLSDNSNINVVDLRAGSAYLNQAIAVFKFSQAYKTFDIACKKQDTYGVLGLVITNTTAKTISFSYTITAVSLANIITLQYQNTSSIPPNGSLSIGNIYNGPVKLTSQRVTITTGTITYL